MATPLRKDFVAGKHLGLAVAKPDIPDFVRKAAEENGLSEKPEVHISIVVTKNAQILWHSITSEQVQIVEELYKGLKWEYELTDQYFLHERYYTRHILDEHGDTDMPEHQRRSIVQKVLLPGLVTFYTKLNALAGTTLSVPVPHVTLFALEGRGIGINSAEDFAQFTKAHIVP
jgi:hypothetical protein